MTNKLIMLASWQTHFMTSILVTNSQCVKIYTRTPHCPTHCQISVALLSYSTLQFV